jgi:hypothetical protein
MGGRIGDGGNEYSISQAVTCDRYLQDCKEL